MDISSSSNSNFPSCDEVLEMTSSSSPSYKSTHYHCRSLDEEQFFTTVATSPPKRRAGRKKFRETRHPVYRGVRKRNGNRWVCEVREPGKKSRIWLGTFPTPEMAARAHDVAAMALRGRSACLNFSDSAWLLPIPATASAKDIQKAAAEAAEAFRPSESESDSESVCNQDVSESVSNQDVGAESGTVSTEDMLLLYMDEEVNFGIDMPGLLASMAEGLLLSPPHSSSEFHWDDVEDYVDMSLWSYSIPIGN